MPHILGVRVDNYSRQEALEKVWKFLADARPQMIFTPNPEMLVAAHKDRYLRDILNQGSLNLCDGRGLELALKFARGSHRKLRPTERITGIDFMFDVCRLSAEQGRSVYLLGAGDENIVKNAVKKLHCELPQLKITGFHHGLPITYHLSFQPATTDSFRKIVYQKDVHDTIIDNIRQTNPDILFVAFGHEKQEKWIYENLPDLPGVKLAMGVGGAFDILGGKIKRAPALLRKLGLEWLWRLIQQPRRLKRIWTAIVIFPYLYLKSLFVKS